MVKITVEPKPIWEIHGENMPVHHKAAHMHSVLGAMQHRQSTYQHVLGDERKPDKPCTETPHGQ